MSTQCRFCGEAVRPDSMFCPSCGQLIGMPGSVVPPFPGGAASTSSGAPVEQRPSEPLPPVPLPAPLTPEPAPQVVAAPPQTPAPQNAPAQSAPQPQVSPAAPAIPTTVTLPDGRLLGLDQVLVFGRSPERGAAAYQGLPFRLDDPERAMSRVHLVLAPAAGAVIATDPGSANGTLLERDGVQYALVSGTPSALVAGDRLLLGDAVLRIS